MPTLVVQGTKDAFGSAAALRRAVAGRVATAVPPPASVDVVAVAGADHGFHVLQRDGGPAARERRLADALDAVGSWLSSIAGVGEQSGRRLG